MLRLLSSSHGCAGCHADGSGNGGDELEQSIFSKPSFRLPFTTLSPKDAQEHRCPPTKVFSLTMRSTIWYTFDLDDDQEPVLLPPSIPIFPITSSAKAANQLFLQRPRRRSFRAHRQRSQPWRLVKVSFYSMRDPIQIILLVTFLAR